MDIWPKSTVLVVLEDSYLKSTQNLWIFSHNQWILQILWFVSNLTLNPPKIHWFFAKICKFCRFCCFWGLWPEIHPNPWSFSWNPWILWFLKILTSTLLKIQIRLSAKNCRFWGFCRFWPKIFPKSHGFSAKIHGFCTFCCFWGFWPKTHPKSTDFWPKSVDSDFKYAQDLQIFSWNPQILWILWILLFLRILTKNLPKIHGFSAKIYRFCEFCCFSVFWPKIYPKSTDLQPKSADLVDFVVFHFSDMKSMQNRWIFSKNLWIFSKNLWILHI